jgi:hypothetical protein
MARESRVWPPLSSAALRRKSLIGSTVLQYRSLTTRSNGAKFAPLAAAVLALFAITGCQNNADRDLIARDRRLQEDHLYAMEDYVSQYQQLVCQYRSENAALRRQLAEETGVTTERNLEPTPRSQPSGPTRQPTPQIEAPTAPGRSTKPPVKPNTKGPDVPPLGQGALINPNGSVPPLPDAQLATYNASVYQLRPNTAGHQESTKEDSHDLLLSGEVVANETGAGPRLMVDVEAFDQSGAVAPFEGNASLMLLSKNDDGGMHKLARWDFGPDDVRAAVDSSTSEPTMRFHVELPPDMQITGATELWVKLTPASGGKLLSHAKVDLSQPGVFSSRTDKIWKSEESVIAASYTETPVEPTAGPVIAINAPIKESAWATAEPGKPANLPTDSGEPGAGWRASNELIPTVVASSASSGTTPKNISTSSEAKAKDVAPPRVAQRPSWTPERNGRSSPPVKRPSWSVTR